MKTDTWSQRASWVIGYAGHSGLRFCHRTMEWVPLLERICIFGQHNSPFRVKLSFWRAVLRCEAGLVHAGLCGFLLSEPKFITT